MYMYMSVCGFMCIYVCMCVCVYNGVCVYIIYNIWVYVNNHRMMLLMDILNTTKDIQ